MHQSNNRLLIRTLSKQTDELATIDSPHRQSRSRVKSMHHTIEFMKKLSQSKNINFGQTQPLWYQSASSIRRQNSPVHRFPQAQRFSSLEQDERKNKLMLKINIAGQLSNSKVVSFAKSKRIDHFRPKQFFADYPSPASYCSEILSSRTEGRQLSTANEKRSSLIKLTDKFINPEIKGITIPRQKNPSKVFMHHGQKLCYQPQVTLSNPGVGKYHINPQNINTKKFHMGQTLAKFNEFIPRNPGPGAYGKQQEMAPRRVMSANSKGTFALSKRTYLANKLEEQYCPSPNSYKIKRFLQK